MSAVVGERDRALRSTIPRNINPTAGKDLLLDADPLAAHFNYDGTATTPTITLTAKPIGFDATVLWSIAGGGVLSGTGKNVRTMAASSMTSASVKVVITSVFEGQAYIATRTIFKSTDGKPGLDGAPADLSPASLLAALEGRITDSQLYPDLRAKINLITDPVSQPGSVQAQIKAETDARVVAIGAEAQIRNDAIGKEVGDRIAAVLAEAGARSTQILNYGFSKEESTSALSIQATQIAAAYTAYADAARAAAVSTAAADVRAYGYSFANADGAIAAAENRLRTEFTSNNGATQAYVQSWSFSKADSLAAETAQTNTLTANYQGYADQKKAEAIAVAAADVRSYTTAKSDLASAEVAQTNALTAAYTTYADAARAAAISAAAADVRSYGYSFANANEAIAAAENRLRAEFVSSGGATEAYVQGWSYSKADTDYAETLQTNQLTTNYKAYTDDKTGQAVTNANAFTQQYAYAKSDAAGAFSSLSTQITAAYKAYTDAANVQTLATSSADVRSYSVAKTELAGAIAQATSSLSTTVGQNTATIQQQAMSLNGLGGQLTWKIDANGHVSGFGLASTPINGVPYSAMIFNVDVLAVALPGGAGKPIFTVGQVNGQSQAVFRTDLLVDGGITASKITVGTPDNVITDPNIDDLAWWGAVGYARAADYNFGNTPWKSRRTLLFEAQRPWVDIFSQFFPMTPGAEYYTEYSAYLSGDFSGNVSVVCHLPGQSWWTLGGQDMNYAWPPEQSGLRMNFDGSSAKGFRTFNSAFTMASTTQQARAQIRIVVQVFAGYIEIGGMSITRRNGNVLIADGAVTTEKLIISQGGAIYSGQTGFDLGEGFWLEGANADHGARLSLGNSGGAKILADPRRGIFGLYNFPIINPQLAQKTITGLYNIVGMNGIANNTKQSLGSQTASMSNASGAISYVWSTETTNGTLTIAPNGASCSIYAQAPRDGRCQGNINCTGTDGSGFSASTSILVDVGFGSGVPT